MNIRIRIAVIIHAARHVRKDLPAFDPSQCKPSEIADDTLLDHGRDGVDDARAANADGRRIADDLDFYGAAVSFQGGKEHLRCGDLHALD